MTRLSISKAWDEAVVFMTSETRLLVPLALALLFLPGVVTGLVAPGGVPADAPGPGLLLMFAELLIGAVGQLAIARLALGHREQLGASIRHATLRLPSYVGALLLVAVPLSLLLGVTTSVARALPKGGNPAIATILLLVMTILLVGLVIVMARCLLNNAIAAVEPGGPIAILKRGFVLTRGQVLLLLAAVILFLVGGGIALFAVTRVVGLGVTLLLGPPEPLTVGALLIALAGGALQAVLGVIFTVFFARLYAQRVIATGVPNSGT